MRTLQPGDFVEVYISGEASFTAKIQYLPASDGDSWILALKDNRIVYVKDYQMIKECK